MPSLTPPWDSFLSAVGGGLLVLVGNWFKDHLFQTRQREAAYLQEQLKLLYGPLYLYTALNASLVEYTQRLSAYTRSPHVRLPPGTGTVASRAAAPAAGP
jgi:hypothetical protein